MANVVAHRAKADGICSECGAEYHKGELIYGDRCAACRAASANSHEVDREKGEVDKQWTLVDLVTHHKKQLRENVTEFQRTFGKTLHKYMHPLFGFDIIAFDDFLQTPDGTSTHDYLLQKYGQAALDLVERLIK